MKMCQKCGQVHAEAIFEQAQKQEPDKYVMDIECTNCGTKQSGILTVNTTTPQRQQEPVAGWCDGCNPDNCQGCGPAAKQNLTDKNWYFVRYEGLGKTYAAPALYKKDAKAFYSIEFSGIPEHQVEVICDCTPSQRQSVDNKSDNG